MATPPCATSPATIDAGEKVVLLGSNGCGKSTLLKILNGLLAADGGRVVYDGHDVARDALRTRRLPPPLPARGRPAVPEPRRHALQPTVRDEIAFGPRQHRLPDAEDRARTGPRPHGRGGAAGPGALDPERRPETAGVPGVAAGPWSRACCCWTNPPAALDPRSTGWLVDFLQDLPQTVVVATHNLSLATELGERCLVMGEDHTLLHDGDVLALRDDDGVLRAPTWCTPTATGTRAATPSTATTTATTGVDHDRRHHAPLHRLAARGAHGRAGPAHRPRAATTRAPSWCAT